MFAVSKMKREKRQRRERKREKVRRGKNRKLNLNEDTNEGEIREKACT